MVLANWTNAQVTAQLDSGLHLSGSNWTFAFPTSNTWIPAGQKESSGFAPLNTDQQQAAILAIKLWDDLIQPNITANGSDPASTITVQAHTNTGSFAYAYQPGPGWML